MLIAETVRTSSRPHFGNFFSTFKYWHFLPDDPAAPLFLAPSE